MKYRTPRLVKLARAGALVTNKKRRTIRPLSYDPSKTGAIRDKLRSELKRRFKALRQAVIKLVADEDAFGLKKVTPTANTRFSFQSTPDQVKAFQSWLKQQFSATVNGLSEQQLWQRYVEEGFKKGQGRAFEDVKRPDKVRADTKEKLSFYEGTKGEFLKSAFGRPESVDKVKLLAGRAFDELEGISNDMSLRMSRTLTDGLVQGKNPRDIAKDLVDEVDIGETRALTVARTEIIRAHAEGQLEAMDQLGVEQVGVAVEWSTAGDDRVCAECEPLEGVVLKLEEARGMLPRHPNCRCAWIPANVGEDGEEQKATKGEITSAIKASKNAGEDDEWGPNKAISKSRPESQVGNRIGIFDLGSLPPLTPEVIQVSNLFRALGLNDEFFASCERDEGGHCLPGGGGGSGGEGDKEASGAIEKFKELYGEFKDTAVGERVDQAMSFMKDKTKALYDKLEKRYGKTQAIAIMGSAQVLGWGAFGVGAAVGVPVYLPGVSIWGSVPAAALAETYLQAKKAVKKVKEKLTKNEKELTEEEVRKEAKKLIREMERAILRHLKEDPPEKVINAFCATGPGGGQDNSCPPKGGGGKAPTAEEVQSVSEGIADAILNDEDPGVFVQAAIQKGLSKEDVHEVVGAYLEDQGKEDFIMAGVYQKIEDAFSQAEKGEEDDELDEGFEDHDKQVEVAKDIIQDGFAGGFNSTDLGMMAKSSVQTGVSKTAFLDAVQLTAEDDGDYTPAEVSYLVEKAGLEYDHQAAKAAAATAIAADIDDTPTFVEEEPASLPDPAKVEFVKSLPGSTGPILVKDQTGKEWVQKAGASKEKQLRNEADADGAYRSLGVAVPVGGLVETPNGPMKFTEYIKGGQTLGDFEKSASKEDIKAIHQQISHNFVADALMGNWDVVGLSKDNILIKDGKAIRIDNGGSLRYRAQGKEKTAAEFGNQVKELQSMRDPNINPQTASVYKNLTEKDIQAQIKNVLTKKDEVLAGIKDDKTRGIMEKRFEHLASMVKEEPKAPPVTKAPAAKASPASTPTPAPAGESSTKDPFGAPTTPAQAAGHLSDGKAVTSYIEANKGSTPFSPLYLAKLEHMNPDGVKDGQFNIPKFPKGEKSSLEKVAQLQKILPPGTVIKQKTITSETLVKAGKEVPPKAGYKKSTVVVPEETGAAAKDKGIEQEASKTAGTPKEEPKPAAPPKAEISKTYGELKPGMKYLNTVGKVQEVEDVQPSTSPGHVKIKFKGKGDYYDIPSGKATPSQDPAKVSTPKTYTSPASTALAQHPPPEWSPGINPLDAKKDPAVLQKLHDQHDSVIATKFSAGERSSITSYTGSSYASLNEKMRACPPEFDCLQGKHKTMASNIMNAVDKAPPFKEPVTVRRGMHLGGAKAEAFMNSLAKAKESGEEFAFPSITSTSTTSGFSGDVRFEMVAKKGVFVKSISQVPSENEVIVSPRQKFKISQVLKSTAPGQPHLVRLEEID